MFDRFTDRARKVMKLALEESNRRGHGAIDTEHILAGFIQVDTGVGANVVENLDVGLPHVRETLEQLMPPPGIHPPSPTLPFAPGGKRVLELAIAEGRELESNYVGTEHLLLGMLRDVDGLAAQVLTKSGLSLELARYETREFLGLHASDEQKMNATQFSDMYQILKMAGNEAIRCSCCLMDPEHLLAGLVVSFEYEQRWGIDFDGILRALDKHLLPKTRPDNLPELKNSADCNEVLRLALKNAVELGVDRVKAEHLLLALLEFGRGPAFEALSQHGVTFDAFREKIRSQA